MQRQRFEARTKQREIVSNLNLTWFLYKPFFTPETSRPMAAWQAGAARWSTQTDRYVVHSLAPYPSAPQLIHAYALESRPFVAPKSPFRPHLIQSTPAQRMAPILFIRIPMLIPRILTAQTLCKVEYKHCYSGNDNRHGQQGVVKAQLLWCQ